MGVRVWILGLILKLQVGRGLVQCSNQGQIDPTCLRFRDLSLTADTRIHTQTNTHLLSFKLSHTLLWTSTSVNPRTCKTKGGFSLFFCFNTTSMCKPKAKLLEKQIKHTLTGDGTWIWWWHTDLEHAHMVQRLMQDRNPYTSKIAEQQSLISDQV